MKGPEKAKAVWIAPDGLHRFGNVLLSHSQICSTIAAERLNFRVRNGNGWIPLAIATEKWLMSFFSFLVLGSEFFNSERLPLNLELIQNLIV